MQFTIQQKTYPLNESAHTLFERIAHQSWAVLLESSHPSHPDSRYDIISANPVATLETAGSKTTITHKNGKNTLSHKNAFNLLSDLLIETFGEEIPPDDELPFTGGAIGLAGYDLGRQLETIPTIAKADISVPDLAVGLYDWAWILDKQLKLAHFVVVGDDEDFSIRWKWWLSQAPDSHKKPFSLLTSWQSNLSKNDYVTRFNAIQDYLKAGDCYQINLTQRFEAKYSGNEWEAYQQLSVMNQAPFSGFLRLKDSAILSVSPERFLSLHQQKIETKPIKGTRKRFEDPTKDNASKLELQHSLKDRAENLMIVDLLRNDIGRVSVPGSVTVPKLFDIESFAAVHHLVSTITGDLEPQLNACDLFNACFPGGSITGAPKVRAMEIIEELEPHRRNAYCGSLFYISTNGRMDSSITIRTLVACHNTMYVWAGGGIVADSDGDAEYQETFDKLSKILPALKPTND